MFFVYNLILYCCFKKRVLIFKTMDIGSLKKKTINYLYDHPLLRSSLKNTYKVIILVVSALIFSFGFKCFTAPNYDVFWDFATDGTVAIRTLASTGATGLSQIFVSILKLAGVEWILSGDNQYIVNFIFYFVVNIPLCVFAWFKIGKKFCVFTIINCALVTLFGIVIPTSDVNNFVNQVASAVFDQTVARVLLAGICSGLASSLAYSINASTGGADVIAFYFSEKKSRPAGKFSVIINFVIVLIFSILSTIPGGVADEVAISTALIVMIFTFLYMVVQSIVVDQLDTKNKKVSLQIITKNNELSQIIMANVPHGCTVTEAEGGYTGAKQFMIYMSVRKNEAKKVISICKRVDPNCFINALLTEQVYGRFSRQIVE